MGLVSRRREGSVRLVKVENILAARFQVFSFRSLFYGSSVIEEIKRGVGGGGGICQLYFNNRRLDKKNIFTAALVSGADGRAEDKTLYPSNQRPLAWHDALHSSS